MWVNNSSKWHEDTTKTEKFFLQKVVQKCDFDESISKRHKTTNGFVQVKEMLNLIRLTELRGRSVKTLIVLGEEATSPYLKQNIKNDVILSKYFIDLKQFISEFNFGSLQSNREPNLIKLNEFKHKLSLFNIQLEKYYLESIIKELETSDLQKESFFRTANQLEAIIDIYITFLIYSGYSASSLTGYVLDYLKKGKHFTIQKFNRFFSLQQRTYRHFLALDNINDDIADFANLLNTDYDVEVKKPGDSTYIDDQINSRPYLLFEAKSIDVNSFTRNLYDQLLKKLVVKRDRQSLNSFNMFFETAYWSHINSRKINKVNLAGDPMNVTGREKTLLNTLNGLGSVDMIDKTDLPIVDDDKLFKAIYYYNLALGSKSIENSLSLLWTSMESSLPYRITIADVECVRFLVSKILALGCVSRDIYSLSKRIKVSYSQNREILKGCNINGLKKIKSNEDIWKNNNWLSENDEDRFDKIKNASDMLAYDYTKYGMFMNKGKSKDLLARILGSKYSVDYQLQRIYINRNQIVHAGDFISEYTNLWMNMEWYLGKILAFMIVNNQKGISSTDALRELESNYDYVISYLDKNRNIPISDLPKRIREVIFNQYWQSF